MLRFSYFRSDDGEEWKLSGEISGPWVDELRAIWRRIRQHTRSKHALVDLKEVTFIDEGGEQLLAEFEREGAGFANFNGNGSRAVGRAAGNPASAEHASMRPAGATQNTAENAGFPTRDRLERQVR